MKQYLYKHIFLLLLVVAVHVLFGLLACNYQRIYMGDSYEYVYEAMHLIQKGWLYSGNSALPIQAEYLTQRPPLYPLLLSAIYAIGGSNWWMLVVQNLLSIFNILYVHHLFIRKLKPAMQYVFILLLLGYPSQFIQANTIAPELVIQTCFLLYIGHLTHWFETKNIKHIYAMCLWLVLGFCTKPVLYPFAFLHLLIIPLLLMRQNHWRHIALVSTLPLVGVIAYSSYNYTQTGKYHFSSNQAFNALYYYKPYLASTQSEAAAQQFLDTTRRHIEALPSFALRYDAANHIGQNMLLHNFAPYILFHLKHSFRLLIEPGKAEIDLFTGHLTYGRLYQPTGSSLAEQWAKNGIAGLPQYIQQNPSFFWAMLILGINCLRLLGLGLLIKACNRQNLLWILLLACILYFMLITGPIANTRYFLPISLIAIALSTLGYNQWYTKKYRA